MKTKITLRAVILFAVLVASGSLGGPSGLQLISRYEVFIGGVVGLVVWYLAYQNNFSPNRFKKDEPIEKLLEFPGNIKCFARALLGGVVLFWAGWYTMRMFFALINDSINSRVVILTLISIGI